MAANIKSVETFLRTLQEGAREERAARDERPGREAAPILLRLLAGAPKTVTTLCRESGLSLAEGMSSLKELQSFGLVESHDTGHGVEFRLTEEGRRSLELHS